MRKSYALLVLIPFGILAACENSESDGGNLLLDGGQPTIDAGEVPPSPPSPVDAGDAGPLPVSVTVTNIGGPEANVPVVFQEATGAVIATVMTSATGLAAQVVPAGSQVTVVMGTELATHLLTITEVAPGDMLTALDLPMPIQWNTSVVSVPSAGPANAILVANIGGCAGGFTAAPPLDVSISPMCSSVAGTFPVLVTAHDQTSAEVGFTYKKSNQFFAPDGGEQDSVDVTEPWSTAFNAHTIAVTNVPASQGVTTVFSEIASGVARSQNGNVSNQSPNAGSFETQHKGHTGYPDFVQSEILDRRSDGDVSVSAIATREAPAAGDATTTFNYADLLPHVDPTTIDVTTRERPSVTWKAEEGKSFDTADGAYVYLAWYIGEGEGARSADWTLVTPANRTSVKAPQLPANLAQFAPPPNEDGGVNVSFLSPAAVTVVEGAAINGYTDFRKISAAVPASAAMNWSNGAGTFIPPLPAAGTLRASAYTRNSN